MWDFIFFRPTLNILIVFYRLLGQNLGLAIICLTVFIRFLLLPLTLPSLRSAKKMQELKPKLDKLKKKHKNDKAKHLEEQMKLYKEHEVNPAAGCLPLLLQFPVLIALYQGLIRVLGSTNGDLSWLNDKLYFPFLHFAEGEYVNTYFLGINLTLKPQEMAAKGAYWYLLFPILVGVLQFIQSKMTMPVSIQNTNKKDKLKGKQGKDDEKKEEDFGQMLSSQMIFMMPLMTFFFALSFPTGLSFYWLTHTVFAIMQQYFVNRGKLGFSSLFKIKETVE